jgi:iron complex outermembrane receptor protein
MQPIIPYTTNDIYHPESPFFILIQAIGMNSSPTVASSSIVRATISLLGIIILIETAPAQERADTSQSRSRPVIIEAFRTPLGIDSVPYAVSAIDAAEGKPGLGLGEVLATVPGVQADNRFNYAVGDRIAIRGFGARTQFGVRGVRIVSDGIPMTFADGQSALESVDPADVEHAEVIRGPASALYGNAAGGVILLRSTPIPASPLLLSTNVTAGSQGLFRSGSRLSGRSGAAAYGLDLSRFRYTGYREHSDATVVRAKGAFLYEPAAGERVRLTGGYTRFDADNPGSLSQQLVDQNPRQAFSTNVKQKTGKDGKQGELGAEWDHDLGWSRLALEAHAIRRDIVNPIVGRIIDLGRTAGGARAMLEGTLDLAGTEGSWTAGAEFDLQIDDRQNHVNNDGDRGALTLDQDERVVGFGSFLQAALPVASTLRLMGSLRYDRIGFNVTDRFIDSTDPDDSGERLMDALNPSFGVLWLPVQELGIYTDVATAFETPTTTELANRPDGAGGFNPELQPQHAISFEGGIRGRFGSLLSCEITAYNVEITGELIPFQEESFPGRDFYRNAGSSVHRGAEATLELTPFSGALVRAGYSYTDARFTTYRVSDKVYDGNRVPGIAPGRLDLALSYLTSPGWYFALDMRSVSRTMTDDANSASAPAYTLFGFRSGHAGLSIDQGNGGWSYELALFAGVENLFDIRYNSSITVNAFGGRYYEPGAGRTFYGGVELGIGRRRQ